MRAMTIVALGRHRVPQLGDLAMECLKVGFCNILVTFAALRGDRQLESLVACT